MGTISLVPLSEDEERILHEIEQQLHATDPQLVREVGSTTLYRHAGRNLKWAALGFVAGLVFLMVTFTTSTPLAALGFLAMLGSALAFERNLRKMGKAGWRQWTQSVGASGVRDYFGNASSRVRDRFKRDES
ncbi:MAG: hypothetical protein QOI47_929 [Actinomycetota bacterium]|nr:hypothetical protein [Actinomycetota bacterium]